MRRIFSINQCDAMIVSAGGGSAESCYWYYAATLKREIESYARYKGINYTFNYEFIADTQEAWQRAQESLHDIYFIDASADVDVASSSVHSNRVLSACIKNLHPERPIVEMSMINDFSPWFRYDETLFTWREIPFPPVIGILRKYRLFPD